MYKKITTRLEKEEIKREVSEDYEHLFYNMSEEAKKELREADITDLLDRMVKIADKNCLALDDTYFYEYVKAIRNDFPWEDLVVEYTYETEEACSFGAPVVNAYLSQ